MSTTGRCEADLSRLKEDLVGAMKTKLGEDMGSSRLCQRSYPAEFDLVSFLAGWFVPNFMKFSGDDNKAH